MHFFLQNMKRQSIILTTAMWAAGSDAASADTLLMPDLVLVAGGTFQMGGYVSDGEEPVHRITVSTFHIGRYPVSVRQYRLFCAATGKAMPENHIGWGADVHTPIVNVTYDDAVGYCDWLSAHQGGDWRLPTEAEWEYAARGGAQSKGYLYSGSDDLSTVAWFGGNIHGCAVDTGRKQANELGIYDMSGNVWEWCWDWYDPGYYAQSPLSNPQGPTAGSKRVLRGGAWDEIPVTCRVAYRSSRSPNDCRPNSGFRVVLSQ